jgi:hypothetical protein
MDEQETRDRLGAVHAARRAGDQGGLAGHDHETSDEDAEAMEALETKTLAVLGIPDPYGDRTAATGI